jgi:hypothetical protein
VKPVVRSAVDIEARNTADPSTDEHLSIALHRDRIDGATGPGTGKFVLKPAVQSAVRVEPRDKSGAYVFPGPPEAAPDEHLAVALHHDRIDGAVSPEGPLGKPLSRVPSALRRAILVRPTPLTMLKLPPMSTLPPLCTATEWTTPSAPENPFMNV